MIREELAKLLEKLREEVKTITKDMREHGLSEVNFNVATVVEGYKVEIKVTIKDLLPEFQEAIKKWKWDTEWAKIAKEKWGVME